MIKLSKKGVLFFAAAMAVCAFVLPSVAAASSWGPVPSHHSFDSPNLGFTSPTFGLITSQCTRSSITAIVTSAAHLELTTGTFGGLCTASGSVIGTCTTTPVATGFPWTATAVTTSNIQIHGVDIDVRLENPPGQNTCSLLNGSTITITGTLIGGNWTGNGVHALDFNNAEGLVAHLAGAPVSAITMRLLLTDTSSSLVVN